MRKLAVLFISAVTALTSFAPAQAFPSAPVKAATAQTDIVQVRDHRERRIIRNDHRRHGWDRNRHSNRWDRRHNNRHGYYRNDYRRHRNNNAGAIIGGLAAGAIIGGAIAIAAALFEWQFAHPVLLRALPLVPRLRQYLPAKLRPAPSVQVTVCEEGR